MMIDEETEKDKNLNKILQEFKHLSKFSDYPLNSRKHFGTYFKYIKPEFQIEQSEFDLIIDSSNSGALTTTFKAWIDEGKGSDLFSEKIVNYFKRKSNSKNLFEIYVGIIDSFEHYSENEYALWSALYNYLKDENLGNMQIQDGNQFRFKLQDNIKNIFLKCNILQINNSSSSNSKLLLQILDEYVQNNSAYKHPELLALLYYFDVSIIDLPDRDDLGILRDKILKIAFDKDTVGFLKNIISIVNYSKKYAVWNQYVPKLIGYDECITKLKEIKSKAADELINFFQALQSRDSFYSGFEIDFKFEEVKIKDFGVDYVHETILGVRPEN